ncbi:MAG: RNA-binding transcriptional accessory protein [Erysipelotrichales bacterium]|nr:RNA-binding transcriptional accessory protein [Erysipelotrichales bacterium]
MNNELIINELVESLGINKDRIEATLQLLNDGATIPFIARYRKDVTGALDENQIKTIGDSYSYYQNLLDRKEAVIRLIDEKGLLTEELKTQIMNAKKLVEVEDLYLPYKEKKKTKASDAINNGLEPLAKMIMSFPTTGTLEDLAKKFVTDKVLTTDAALEGAGYIIAEWISDNANTRKWIRNYVFNNGILVSKIKKTANDEKKLYDMYYDYSEPIKHIKHYRLLAINRGEKEKILSVSIDMDEVFITSHLEEKMIKNPNSYSCDLVKSCIKDSLKRLILPSIEREIRSDITEKAELKAIETFSVNLEHLLLTRPIKGMTVLGFDPGYVNGCKLAVVDSSGKYLDSTVIKPFLNSNKEQNIESSKLIVKNLIEKYKVDIISIGNGTASRESEKFCAELIKEYNFNCKYVITSEAGASIYSASKLAIEEFPDLAVEKRSAVSIGRRIQDPLSELVKIDPKSIGVGEYQYDVNQKQLGEALDFVTSKVVNEVGVNINTASTSILKYVSGLTKSVIDKIIAYKENHKIENREDIKNIKGVSDKVYEQAIGFLRIPNGSNPLDNTGIHPESYSIANNLLNELKLSIKDINKDEFKETLKSANINELVNILKSNEYTITDIIKELLNPGLDPRDELESPILKSDILHIEDLRIGMELEGTVRNVASFGAFVDIGLHDDGLIHISKMSKSFVKNPNDILNVGDIIKCYVDGIDLEKQKVQLSLIKP